ncbi:hypothetical protein BLNAU_17780 [Blattamonas nauphoetae]|uniref:DDE-1 domain-containing protein n=1 Tax=Blattamonas nauphoetae TaxID=2049346 RepID=A0ABQ9X8V3_9EUKA|nr:hypothetical protein BLNAU_17780 [Blattamonas nauphoetae]
MVPGHYRRQSARLKRILGRKEYLQFGRVERAVRINIEHGFPLRLLSREMLLSYPVLRRAKKAFMKQRDIQKNGRPSRLNLEKRRHLVSELVDSVKIQKRITARDVTTKVGEVVPKPISPSFSYNLLHSEPKLDLTQPKVLSQQRITSSTVSTMKDLQLFSLNQPKLVHLAGCDPPPHIQPKRVKNATAMCVISADRTALKTHLIWPSERPKPEFDCLAPFPIVQHFQKSGYVNSSLFETIVIDHIFEEICQKRINLQLDDKWALLITDGPNTHLSPVLGEKGKVKQIHVLILPPNTTHITQPLDQTVYKRLKGNLRTKYNPPDPFTSAAHRAEIARILPGSLASCLNPDAIQESFEVTGIYPLSLATLLKNGHLIDDTTHKTERNDVKTRQSRLLTESTGHIDQDIPPPITQPKARNAMITDFFSPRKRMKLNINYDDDSIPENDEHP